MRKTSLLTAFIFFFSVSIFSQNAFYDAKKLVQLSKQKADSNRVSFAAILGQYLTDAEIEEFNKAPTTHTMHSIFYKQPALKKMLISFVGKETNCDKIVSIVKTFKAQHEEEYNENTRLKPIMDLIIKREKLLMGGLVPDLLTLKKIDTTQTLKGTDSTTLFALESKYLARSRNLADSNIMIATVYQDVAEQIASLKKAADKEAEAMCKSITGLFARSALSTKLDSFNILYGKTDMNFQQSFQIKIKEVEEASFEQHSENEQYSAPKLNLPSQSEMIDAMAIYLANRVKLETALTFIEYIKKSLKDDPILLNLFPRTIKLFSTYGTYELPNFGSAWQQAFAEDFVMIPQRISSYGDTASYFYKKYNSSPVFKFLNQCIELNVLSFRKGNITDIVQLLNEKYADIGEPSVFQKFIRIFYMINEQLFSIDKNKFWVSYSDFNKLSKDEFEVFAALLEKKYDNGVFDFLQVNVDKWDDALSYKLNLKEFKGWLGQIMYTINQFQNNQQGLSGMQQFTAIRSNENFWGFLPQLFRFVTDKYKQVESAPGKSIIGEDASGPLQKFISTYGHLAEMYQSLEKKDYSVAFDRTVAILDDIISETNAKKGRVIYAFIKENYRHAKKLKNEEFVSQVSMQLDALNHYVYPPAKGKIDSFPILAAKFLQTLQSNKVDHYFPRMITNADSLRSFLRSNDITQLTNNLYEKNYNSLTRTVSFINDVRKAGDSKTLSRVIASYANPPLSYKKKRASRFSLDLNANVGVFAGGEFRLAGPFSYSDPGVVYGLSAPIGFSASWGRARQVKQYSNSNFIDRRGHFKKMSENNFSVLLSIIDIGAAVAYRISTGPENALPQKVTFAQVIAPGLHAQWGLRNTPLCLSIGGQYTPELRKFSKAPDAKSETAFSVRAAVFFDLPLLNMYRR